MPHAVVLRITTILFLVGTLFRLGNKLHLTGYDAISASLYQY